MIGVNGLSQIAEKEEGWVEYGDDQNKVQLKIAKVAKQTITIWTIPFFKSNV